MSHAFKSPEGVGDKRMMRTGASPLNRRELEDCLDTIDADAANPAGRLAAGWQMKPVRPRSLLSCGKPCCDLVAAFYRREMPRERQHVPPVAIVMEQSGYLRRIP